MQAKKSDLINTAARLFSINGFNATGIDKILLEANVSKMTMYKYFRTKDELIIAVLEDAHEKFATNILHKIDNKKISAEKKIIELFDILHQFTKKRDVVRCLFINASAEFYDIKNPIHQKAVEHKISTEKFVRKLLKEARIQNSAYLARSFSVLTQGALVMAQVTDDRNYYKESKRIFLQLIKSS